MSAVRMAAGFAMVGTAVFWLLDGVGRSALGGQFLNQWLFSGEPEEQIRNGIVFSFWRGVISEGALLIFLIAFLQLRWMGDLLAQMRRRALLAGIGTLVYAFGAYGAASIFYESMSARAFDWTILIAHTVGAASLLVFLAGVVQHANSSIAGKENERRWAVRIVGCFAAMGIVATLAVDCLPFLFRVYPIQTVEMNIRLCAGVAMALFLFVIGLSGADKGDRNAVAAEA